MLIPKNRHEYYLAVISGNDYPTFLPKIREEQYLAKLAGREVDVSNPKTPKERAYFNIINDIKFEPENRWQTFVAAANDDSITSPVPITREEIWWANISLSHEVIVEYTGTLPATLQTVEGYLESYKIYGNTAQDGTPTPENPIMPEGCGEKTVNLYNINAKDENNGYINNAQLTQDGTVVTWGTAEISEYIPISGDTAYTFNGIGSYNSPCYALYDESKQLIGAYRYNGRSIINFTSPSNARYFRFTHIKTYPRTMMVEGTYTSSTMPEYEPYGYKLPILSNSTLTNIYLGKMETTRRIKKLVLTGTSADGNSNVTAQGVIFITPTTTLKSVGAAYCTHFKYVNQNQGSGMPDNSFTTSGGSGTSLWFKTNYASVADFKSYLAQQYANGTPVTVWYVLATEKTAVVNEPLMKIGDYADVVDSTQATVQIPTTANSTTISWAGEGLAPSKVELTYKTIKKTYVSADDKVYQDTNGQLLGG